MRILLLLSAYAFIDKLVSFLRHTMSAQKMNYLSCQLKEIIGLKSALIDLLAALVPATSICQTRTYPSFCVCYGTR